MSPTPPGARQQAQLDQVEAGAPVPEQNVPEPKPMKMAPAKADAQPMQITPPQPVQAQDEGAPVAEEPVAPVAEEDGAPVPDQEPGAPAPEETPIDMAGLSKANPRGPGLTPAHDWISQNLKSYHGDAEIAQARDTVNPNLSFVDQCKAALGLSWKNSDLGIMTNGLPPPMPPNLTKMARICAIAGETAGDIPSFIMGAGIGEVTAPESKIPVVGPILAAGHASGMANAFHMGLRKVLIDGYESGDVKTPAEAAERMAGTAWDMVKGYAAGLGGAAAGSTITRPLLKTATEAYTMTAIASALEGELPSKESMMNAAISVAGIHAAHSVLPKIQQTYINTGEKPAELAYRLQKDPELLQKFLNNVPNEPPEASQSHWDPDTKQPMVFAEKPGGAVPEEPNAEGVQPKEPEPIKLPDEAAPNTGQPLGAPPNIEDVVKEEPILKGSAEDLGLSDSAKKILSYIGSKDESTKPVNWEKIKDDIANVYGERLARDSVPARIYEKAGIPRMPSDAAALMQKYSAIGDVVDQFVGGKTVTKETYGGTRDWFTGKINGESFEHIKDDYRKQNPDDPYMLKLKSFGIASRILEKSSQLDEQGNQKYNLKVNGESMSVEDARKVVDEHPEVKEVMDRFVAWKQRGLEYMHNSGFWTEKEFEAMKSENESHMSFQRVQDVDQLTQTTGGKAKNVKRLVGEGDLLQDPIISGIKDMDMMVRAAHANEVATTFLYDMQKVGFPEEFIRSVPTPKRPIEISADEITKHLKAQGEEIDPAAARGLTVFRTDYNALTKGQFRVQIEGKSHTIETTPLMADAINSLTGHPQTMALWAQVLAPFARTLTKSTMWLPGFASRHMFKNERNAQVFSQTELTSFTDVLMNIPKMFNVRGFNEAYEKGAPLKEIAAKLLSPSEAWQDAKFGQTFTSGVGLAGEDMIKQQLYDLDPNVSLGRKTWNQVKGTAAGITGFAHYAIVAADNAVRFTERQRVMESGGSEVAANFAGRQVVPDYQRAAIQKNSMTGICSFLQAHLASDAQLVDMIKKDAPGVVARSLLQYTATSLLIYAASQNDDRVDDQKHVMNDNYMLYPIDNWRPATAAMAKAASFNDPGLARQMQDGSFQINDGPVARIPRSWTLDTIFGAGPIAAMQSLKQQNPDAVRQWAKDAFKSLIPNVMPQALEVGQQIATNHNTFMDGPLVSPSTERLLPLYQNAKWTSESAKQIAKLVHNVPGLRDWGTGPATLQNPQVVDSIIRGFGGATGDYATSLVDGALRKAGVEGAVTKPAWEITQYPIIKEFFLQVPGLSNQPTEDFYKNLKMTKETLATEKFYSSGSTPNTLREIHNNYGEFEYNMGGYEKTMSNLNKMIQGVAQNPKMSASDKSQLIEPLLFYMMGTAKHGNAALKQFQQQRNMVH